MTVDGSPAAEQLRLFAIMWAIVTLFHVWINSRSQLVLFVPWWDAGFAPRWESVSHVLLTVIALWVLVRPGRLRGLLLLAAVQVLSAWLELPFLGNHWLLVAFVALALLIAAGLSLPAGRPIRPATVAERFLPAARITLLVCYGCAAFSKLNTGFFTPSRSCASFYAAHLSDSFWLPAPPGTGPLSWVPVAGTVAVECSVPLLLLVRRTRHAGVIVGLLFHGLLALDRIHPFADFSAVLFALFVLFLPPSYAVFARHWLCERVGAKRVLSVALPVSIMLSVVLWTWPNFSIPVLLWRMTVLLWVVLCGGLICSVVAFLRTRPAAPPGMLRGARAPLMIVPLLVLANGLTPYLELKTGFGWNMYSNLRTVAGRSNHFVIRRTWPLSDAQRHLVTVLDTDDPQLRVYVEDRYRIPLVQLRTYAAERPGGRLRYELDGVVREATRIGSDPLLARPVPRWRAKLQLFRAVDMEDPPRCQDLWGAAR